MSTIAPQEAPTFTLPSSQGGETCFPDLEALAPLLTGSLLPKIYQSAKSHGIEPHLALTRGSARLNPQELVSRHNLKGLTHSGWPSGFSDFDLLQSLSGPDEEVLEYLRTVIVGGSLYGGTIANGINDVRPAHNIPGGRIQRVTVTPWLTTPDNYVTAKRGVPPNDYVLQGFTLRAITNNNENPASVPVLQVFFPYNKNGVRSPFNGSEDHCGHEGRFLWPHQVMARELYLENGIFRLGDTLPGSPDLPADGPWYYKQAPEASTDLAELGLLIREFLTGRAIIPPEQQILLKERIKAVVDTWTDEVCESRSITFKYDQPPYPGERQEGDHHLDIFRHWQRLRWIVTIANQCETLEEYLKLAESLGFGKYLAVAEQAYRGSFGFKLPDGLPKGNSSDLSTRIQFLSHALASIGESVLNWYNMGKVWTKPLAVQQLIKEKYGGLHIHVRDTDGSLIPLVEWGPSGRRLT